MKLLDTNVLLRFIVEPVTSHDIEFNRLAREILDAAERGEEQFITSEAVIAEVLYVLTSRSMYAFSRSNAYASMSGILKLAGCQLENRDAVETALEVWATSPKISFVDALCMVMARQQGLELVTFDSALAKAAGTQRWDLRSNDDVTNSTVEMP